MNGTATMRQELNRLSQIRLKFLRYMTADMTGDDMTKFRIRAQMQAMNELQTHLKPKVTT